MKRVFGLILFCIAIGMLLTFFIRSAFVSALLIILFLFIGYRLFCC